MQEDDDEANRTSDTIILSSDPVIEAEIGDHILALPLDHAYLDEGLLAMLDPDADPDDEVYISDQEPTSEETVSPSREYDPVPDLASPATSPPTPPAPIAFYYPCVPLRPVFLAMPRDIDNVD